MALCQHCHANKATIFLSQVAEGVVKKLALCEACARKAGLDIKGSVSITDILLGLGGQTEAAPAAERACPQCHMRRSDFRKQQRLGCAVCYETFAEDLAQLIKAIHRSEQHVGKTPGRKGGEQETDFSEEELRAALQAAIAAERFEEAARLRDRLQQKGRGDAERRRGGKGTKPECGSTKDT